jgi:hypothetical protein
MKLSEADKALVAGKHQGGDKVIFYTDEVEEQVAKIREGGGQTEDQKLTDALTKAEEAHQVGMVVPKGGSDCSKCEYFKGERACGNQDFIAWDGSSSKPAKPAGSGEIPAEPSQYCCDYFQPVEKLTKNAPAMNPGAFSGASRPSAPTIDKPVATQGEHSEAQSLYDLINDDERPAAPEATHQADDFEDELHAHAAEQEKSDHAQAVQSTKNIDDVKQTLVQALTVIKQQAPMLEQMKQAAPDLYAAMMGLTQATVALAREVQGQATPMVKSDTLSKMAPTRFNQLEVDNNDQKPAPPAPKSDDPLENFDLNDPAHTVKRVHNRFVGTKATEKTSGLGATRAPMSERLAFDYSHHLTPQQRSHGLSLTVYHHPGWQVSDGPYSGPQGPLMELSRNGKPIAVRASTQEGANSKFLVPDEELPADADLDARGLKYNRKAALVRAMGDAAYEHVQNTKRKVKQSIAGGAIGDVPYLNTLPLPPEGERAQLLEVDKKSRRKKMPQADPGALSAGLGQQLDVGEGAAPLQVPPHEAREKIVPAETTSRIIPGYNPGPRNLGTHHYWDYSHLLSPEDRQAGRKLEIEHSPGKYDNYMTARLLDNGRTVTSSYQYPSGQPSVPVAAPDYYDVIKDAMRHHVKLLRNGQLEQAIAEKEQPSRFSNLELSEKKGAKAELEPEAPGNRAPEGELEHEQELEKGALPAAHHHVILPPGSTLNGKVKVQHSDGSQSWKSVQAGQILSQDPSGHPVSSRAPNSK